MGIVFRAYDTRLKRTVALKVLKSEVLEPHFLDRFEREAIALARLRHPGIATLYEAGQAQGIRFVAMEYIEGETLESHFGKAPQRKLLEWLEQVARAVHHAHEQNVVHRDLKPGNIMVDREGHPHVVDFGLARVRSEKISLTVSGEVLGTPAYMAPEQVRGATREINAQTDVYALGAILFEILTGRLPFLAKTPAKLYEQIQHADPPSPSRLHRTVSRDLDLVCLKALSKERGRRYKTALEFAEDLGRFLRGEEVQARPPSAWYRLGKTFRRRRVVVLALSAAAGAALLAVGVTRVVQARSAKNAEDRRIAAERQRKKERVTARERAHPQVEHLRENLGKMRFLLRRAPVDPHDVQPLLESSIRAYEKALDICPEYPEAHVSMAQFYGLLGKRLEALRYLSEAYKLEPEFVPAILVEASLGIDSIEREHHKGDSSIVEEHIRKDLIQKLRRVANRSASESERRKAKALLRYAEREYSDAAELFRLLAEQEQDSFEVWLWLGHSLFHLKRYSEAVEMLLKARRLTRVSPLVELYLGWAYADQNENARAIECLTRTIEMAPDAFAYGLRGQCHTRLLRPAEAIADYTAALNLDPNSSFAYLGRCRAHWDQGSSRLVFEDASKVIGLDPGAALAYYLRAVARKALGHPDDAILKDLSDAIDRDPKLAVAYVARGFLYYQKLGQYDRAIEDSSKALDLDPTLCTALGNRGWSKFGKGDYSGAITDASGAIALHPEGGEHFYARARALGILGNFQEAVADLDRCIALKWDDDLTYLYRAEFRKSLKDYAGAVSDCSVVLQRSPQLERAFCVRGWSRSTLGQYEGAQEDFTSAIRLQACGTAYCGRAWVRFKTGDLEGARRDAQEAIKRNPSSDVRKIAQEILDHTSDPVRKP